MCLWGAVRLYLNYCNEIRALGVLAARWSPGGVNNKRTHWSRRKTLETRFRLLVDRVECATCSNQYG